MATNNGKPAEKAPAQPVTHVKRGSEDPEERIESAIGRTEQFIFKHGKTLITVLLVVVVAIGGWMAYKHLYQVKRAEKAGAMMFVAQQNLAEEMYEVALNGDGNYAGFLDVISSYGSTPEGNIAKHYAGECYARLGQWEDAIHYLKMYKHTDGVPNAIVNAQNYGLQGDAYVQMGDWTKAVEMYSKAVQEGANSYTSPMYLKKMGMAYMASGKAADADNAFQRILDEYPMSMEARDIEKYMGEAGQM